MSINKAAHSLARYLSTELKTTKAQEEVLAYGLELIFLGAIGLLAVALAGYLVGAPAETLAALISASLLRLPGGGIHLSSPVKCLSFTAVIFSIMGFLSRGITGYSLDKPYIAFAILFSGLLSLAASFWQAPVTSPTKPINSPVIRRRLRRTAVGVSIVVPLLLLLISSRWPSLALAGAVGLAWQGAIIFLASILYNKEVRWG
ncbi:accessory gene regulator B [Thermanaeromonas toyohensis ToBE]|uniref:Accessory gene regulator B n=1 Tax=Thermanaeromonas toyohensis ToBE TaxID=698762 RepID=A0A1W1VY76_9FIRM|nr:accessory gene regulator B family protein [Thermanaeromonas toyohensis]SMB98200.1 accessory gene regulator B [Thermanaeromonas toyohensis ToBE]